MAEREIESGHEYKVHTTRELVEERNKQKDEQQLALYKKYKSEGYTREVLHVMAQIQNINNMLLYDTLCIFVHDIVGEWKQMELGEKSIVPRFGTDGERRRLKNIIKKMEACCYAFRRMKSLSIENKHDVFKSVSDIYYEAVMNDIVLLEVMVKQQLDDMKVPNSRLHARLEMMREIASLGIGLAWKVEDISFCEYDGYAYSCVKKEENMIHVQHWICEFQAMLGLKPMLANDNLTTTYERFAKRVSTGMLAMECMVIIGDEIGWDNKPSWFPLGEPVDETRDGFMYKSRKDIEG